MYSFTRSLIGAKLARMEIQVRVVVRTTSATDEPVDADLVLDAEERDPVERLHELEARAGGAAPGRSPAGATGWRPTWPAR